MLEGHPEIGKHFNEISKTLADPITIRKSKSFNNRCLYYRSFRSKSYFVVVVDLSKGIIKTSYITDRIKEGEIVWPGKK